MVSGASAAGGTGGLKLHGWKHPAFRGASGYGFPTELPPYHLKASPSAALALPGNPALTCGISSEGLPALLSCTQLRSPSTCCGGDGDPPQADEEQSDPSGMVVPHHRGHLVPFPPFGSGCLSPQEPTCAVAVLG